MLRYDQNYEKFYKKMKKNQLDIEIQDGNIAIQM